MNETVEDNIIHLRNEPVEMFLFRGDSQVEILNNITMFLECEGDEKLALLHNITFTSQLLDSEGRIIPDDQPIFDLLTRDLDKGPWKHVFEAQVFISLERDYEYVEEDEEEPVPQTV